MQPSQQRIQPLVPRRAYTYLFRPHLVGINVPDSAHRTSGLLSESFPRSRKRLPLVCICLVQRHLRAVDRAAAPGRPRRNAPDAIPVTILGRLAIARSHTGHGLGADILSDALRRVALASQAIGIAALLVHDKDASARAFYLRPAEFLEHPTDSRVLWLTVETVVRGM